MIKLNNKEFYRRQKFEILRYTSNKKNILNIFSNEVENELSNNDFENISIDTKQDSMMQLSSLEKNNFDLIIVTDIFEISEDIYNILKFLKSKLNNEGKLLINTVNSRWDGILSLLEILHLKNENSNRSKISRKKFKYIFGSVGLTIQKNYTRQLFPFKLFSIGNFLNTFLELLLFRLYIGIKSYYLLKPDDLIKKIYKKSVVVPAKNEEKNLMPLFERLAKTNLEAEYILVCAESKDKTLEAAYAVKERFKSMNINVFEQKSNGKANAVFEGFEYSSGEVISILDSDISVDPERLVDFFEIIENSNADFVNGTRMIYPMEKNAMRYLNKLGNNFFQYFISKVIFYNLSDSLCGTKVFKKSSLENLKEWRFSQSIIDPFGDFDMIFNAAYEGATIVEIPVHYRSRIYGKTQISRFRDGFKLIIYFLASFKKLNSSKYNN